MAYARCLFVLVACLAAFSLAFAEADAGRISLATDAIMPVATTAAVQPVLRNNTTLQKPVQISTVDEPVADVDIPMLPPDNTGKLTNTANRTSLKHVPTLTFRASYVACRLDYQISVLEGIRDMSATDSVRVDNAIVGLEAAKVWLMKLAETGDVVAYNSYMAKNATKLAQAAADLSREMRKGMLKAENSSYTAQDFNAVYKPAISERGVCKDGALGEAKNLSRMNQPQRVAASQKKLNASIAASTQNYLGAKEKLEVKVQVKKNITAAASKVDDSKGAEKEGKEGNADKGKGNGISTSNTQSHGNYSNKNKK